MLISQRHPCFLLLASSKLISARSPKIGPLVNCFQLCDLHETSSSHQPTLNAKTSQATTSVPRLPAPNLASNVQKNIQWFNQQYERFFGISEIRDTQTKVLEAEHEFVNITQRRKACQDQVENLRDEIKSTRDKRDSNPRQSENYLRLMTEEHKLHLQLGHLKESEQLALDRLSKLLRHSHEIERLRHERAKYWQIISISLSLAGSLVALMTQRARGERSVTKKLESLATDFQCSIEDTVNRMDQIDSKLDRLVSINRLALAAATTTTTTTRDEKSQSWSSWLASWVPGRAAINSMVGYIW